MKRIDILYFDVTSGHRSAAYAIEKALIATDPSAQVRVLNLIDVLQHQPVLQAIARIGVEVFNIGVRHERSWFMRQQIGLFQLIQANIPVFAIEQVSKFWANNPPDAVVSVLPICNLLLERALHKARIDCPYIVIPVDYEECKANYWFDTRMNAYYINPTPMLAQQATARGVQAQHQIKVKGMPIDPLFYDTPTVDHAHALTQLGLNPEFPTVLVGFGGQGSVLVKHCAEQLIKVKQPINAIFLCGRLKALFDELSALPTPYPKAVLSFTPEAPAYYYHLADIIVGKPGSMTITEAIVTRTALLAIESNVLAVVQRGNEAWLRQSGMGEVIRVPDLPEAVQRTLAWNTINAQIEREWHRGVFEIAGIISNVAHGVGLQPKTEMIGEIAKN